MARYYDSSRYTEYQYLEMWEPGKRKEHLFFKVLTEPENDLVYRLTSNRKNKTGSLYAEKFGEATAKKKGMTSKNMAGWTAPQTLSDFHYDQEHLRRMFR